MPAKELEVKKAYVIASDGERKDEHEGCDGWSELHSACVFHCSVGKRWFCEEVCRLKLSFYTLSMKPWIFLKNYYFSRETIKSHQIHPDVDVDIGYQPFLVREPRVFACLPKIVVSPFWDTEVCCSESAFGYYLHGIKRLKYLHLEVQDSVPHANSPFIFQFPWWSGLSFSTTLTRVLRFLNWTWELGVSFFSTSELPLFTPWSVKNISVPLNHINWAPRRISPGPVKEVRNPTSVWTSELNECLSIIYAGWTSFPSMSVAIHTWNQTKLNTLVYSLQVKVEQYVHYAATGISWVEIKSKRRSAYNEPLFFSFKIFFFFGGRDNLLSILNFSHVQRLRLSRHSTPGLFWHTTPHDPEDEKLNIESDKCVWRSLFRWPVVFLEQRIYFLSKLPDFLHRTDFVGKKFYYISMICYHTACQKHELPLPRSSYFTRNVEHLMFHVSRPHMSRTWSAPRQTRWLDRRRVWTKWSAVHRLNLICLHSGQHGEISSSSLVHRKSTEVVWWVEWRAEYWAAVFPVPFLTHPSRYYIPGGEDPCPNIILAHSLRWKETSESRYRLRGRYGVSVHLGSSE